MVEDNKLIEWGMNDRNGRVAKYFGYSPHSGIHSEINAYRRARGLISGEHFDIVNIRLNKEGKMKMSAPCSICYNWLKSVGCQKIYFSTEMGDFAKI